MQQRHHILHGNAEEVRLGQQPLGSVPQPFPASGGVHAGDGGADESAAPPLRLDEAMALQFVVDGAALYSYRFYPRRT